MNCVLDKGVRILSLSRGQKVRGVKHRQHRPSLVIADRWGEIWAAWAGGADHRLPSRQDILQWLEFIQAQCPECTMIEWTEQGEDS